MNCLGGFTICVLLVNLLTPSGGDRKFEAFTAGEPVPVGTVDGRGPLSLGLSNHPVGAATVYGGSRPDLFVTAGTHSSRPGLYLMRFVQTDGGDVPVFENPQPVAHPGSGAVPPAGHIFQTPDGTIHGFWLSGKKVLRTRFDPGAMAFVNAAPDLSISALPSNPGRIAVMVHDDGSAELLFTLTHGGPLRPESPSWRSADYFPCDGRGVWRGGWPQSVLWGARISSLSASSASDVRQISLTDREALISKTGITPLRLEAGGPQGVLTGTRFGVLPYYPNTAHSGLSLAAQQPVVDSSGLSQRHPGISPSPSAYPSLSRPGTTDFIAGGECALYYYRFTGQYAADGRPVFDEPREVLQNNAKLYPGSLPVLSVIDWNGNGLNDLISGNSEGRILFFENIGTPGNPAFKPAVQLHAAGEPIHIQQGYGGIQGPGEARWGYSCPTAVDWNGDGRPDIVTSSATQRHKVYMNTGASGQPRLDRARSLFFQGLDLHGTWRVQPAAAQAGSRMAYVALDDDDEFHLYWRLDDHNVTDGGKLRLTSGETISANFLHAGGTGRSKIVLTDWDRDGKMDLLVGTPRHGSVPDPVKGLPQSLGLPGAAVLFLKNAGSNEAPVFEFPKLMRFRGSPIFHHQHACSPVPWDNGDPSGPDLLVGDQEGLIYYYPRSELSWDPADSVPDNGGLHGYWPLDESAGTQITDATGTFGTGTFNAGVEPGSAAVAGTGIRIAAGGLIELSSTQTELNRDLTISAFVRADSFIPGINAASRCGILWGYNNRWGLAVQNEGRILFLFYDTDRSAYDAVLTPDSVRIATGRFYHIAAVRSSWMVTLYIDGVPVYQGAISGAAVANAKPQLGQANSADRAWNGVLDEIGLWAQPLSGREIAAIAGLGRLAGVPLNSPEIQAVLALEEPGQTAQTGGVLWEYTSGFPEHPDGKPLTAGMNYTGTDGRKYIILSGEGEALSGAVSR